MACIFIRGSRLQARQRARKGAAFAAPLSQRTKQLFGLLELQSTLLVAVAAVLLGLTLLAGAVIRGISRLRFAIALLILLLLVGVAPLLLVAAAMGMENGVFARDGEVAIGVSYMTGSLVRMAQRLAGTLMGDPDRWAFVPPLALWLGFAVGVVLGAKVGVAAADAALWIAAIAAGGLTLVAAGLTRERGTTAA
jgi:uncharacterized membrane protein YoaK (UPF0700 family)